MSTSQLGRLERMVIPVSLLLVSFAALTYPFWIGAANGSLTQNLRTDALPVVAAALGVVVVAAIGFQLERSALRPATISTLAALSTIGGLTRLFDLPAGGNLLFSVIILGAVAFGVQFGFLLGFSSMAVGALLTGGLGPWLPYQMLAAAGIGACCGLAAPLFAPQPLRSESQNEAPLNVIRPHPQRVQRWTSILVLVVLGIASAIAYGLLINLNSWPFIEVRGSLTWTPSGGFGHNVAQYWRYYVSTSLAWDSAGAALNAVVLAGIGPAVLRVLRPTATHLRPSVTWL